MSFRSKMLYFGAVIFLALALSFACSLSQQEIAFYPSSSTIPNAISLDLAHVQQQFPHDSQAYTQGLVYDKGFFYESTGRYGKSTLRRVEVATGKVLQQRTLSKDVFAEGLTLFEDQLIQLTWKSKTGFVYDKASFDLQQTFQYPTEGWGLTQDGKHLIMSDGSHLLYFLNPHTFQEVHRVAVTENGKAVQRLNELEWIHEEIWANVWQSSRILRIDPQTGVVRGSLDLQALWDSVASSTTDVPNGIAYDASEDRIFVTGKWWPTVFEISLKSLMQ